MKDKEYDAIVVGAGVAGLNCARQLEERGMKTVVLEAADRPGGRIRTDEVDGFRLDRGFQVLLTAYPQCRDALDYESLKLGLFEPGALVWNGTSLVRMSDPLRRPTELVNALTNPVGTFGDKMKIGWVKASLMAKSIDSIYAEPDIPTYNWLRGKGLTEGMVEGFIRPFFSGIFLEEGLSTTRRMFDFVFKMFSTGHAALPEGGMQAIPDQLAGNLKEGTLCLNQSVSTVSRDHVILDGGEKICARAVIIATDMENASRLHPGIEKRGWNRTTCLYFDLDEAVIDDPIILLNGSGKGVISNACMPSGVADGYAPAGRNLLCISLKPDVEVSPESVLEELSTWLGRERITGRFIKTFHIPHALPRQDPGDNAFGKAALKLPDGVWVCGDHRYSSSIEGAMASGWKVGRSVLED